MKKKLLSRIIQYTGKKQKFHLIKLHDHTICRKWLGSNVRGRVRNVLTTKCVPTSTRIQHSIYKSRSFKQINGCGEKKPSVKNLRHKPKKDATLKQFFFN